MNASPQAYCNNLVDHHLILDLIPLLARYFFGEQLPVSLSLTQGAILLSVGLQRADVNQVIMFNGREPLGALLELFWRHHVLLSLSGLVLASIMHGNCCFQVAELLALPVTQVLALFNKMLKKLYGVLRTAQEEHAGRSEGRSQQGCLCSV